jgi:hypothetical protein
VLSTEPYGCLILWTQKRLSLITSMGY